MLQSPFDFIPKHKQKNVFYYLLSLTILVLLGMQISGAPLKTDAAPLGIISFEFAGDLATSQTILTSWGITGRFYAALNTGLDFLFLFSYACTFALGCVLAARFFEGRSAVLSRIGVVMAWGQIAAGLFDAIENFALIQMLIGTQSEIWPQVAFWFAAIKFILVGIGISYLHFSTAWFLAYFFARNRV